MLKASVMSIQDARGVPMPGALIPRQGEVPGFPAGREHPSDCFTLKHVIQRLGRSRRGVAVDFDLLQPLVSLKPRFVAN